MDPDNAHVHLNLGVANKLKGDAAAARRRRSRRRRRSTPKGRPAPRPTGFWPGWAAVVRSPLHDAISPCAVTAAGRAVCLRRLQQRPSCTAHNPLACAGDSGTGGGSGACLDFGSSCSADGQCCATTLVNGTAYPLACSRIHYCQIASPYCLADKSFCTSSDQCCTGSCDSVKHQCAVCGRWRPLHVGKRLLRVRAVR